MVKAVNQVLQELRYLIDKLTFIIVLKWTMFLGKVSTK
jgi:hypothetical protein